MKFSSLTFKIQDSAIQVSGVPHSRFKIPSFRIQDSAIQDSGFRHRFPISDTGVLLTPVVSRRLLALGVMLLWIFMPILRLHGQEVKIVVAATSDVHGCLFPYDFEEGQPGKSSLAGVYHLTDSIRRVGIPLLLLENGDLVQGTPVAYYANFVQKKRKNLFSRALNLMDYDAATAGNHDIEAGPAVYYRMQRELQMPYLGANILNDTTGEPRFKPYTIFRREGITIAILGMITPSVPEWLPQKMWKGLSFSDMVPEARRWVEIIREREDPDLMVGLFHTGFGDDEPLAPGKAPENAGLRIAQQVPGFDLIVLGHDHRRRNEWITRSDSSRVLLLNPGNAATHLAVAQFTLSAGKNTPPRLLKTEGTLLKVPETPGENRYTRRFRKDRKAIGAFSDRKVGTLSAPMTGVEALFGNSAFLDLIHKVQLKTTGADLSLAAPLSVSGEISAGDLRVRDLFQIYRFENYLYTMALTGEEIKNHLEYSYGLWLNTMTSPNDHLLLFSPGRSDRKALTNPYYNFDSAAGILYTVDVTQPTGNRVTITGFEDGRPFDPLKTYRVAINSYRGSGGGGHLTTGAGIPREKLQERITWSSDTDLRTLLMRYLENHGTLHPTPGTNWKIIPEEYASQGRATDLPLLSR